MVIVGLDISSNKTGAAIFCDSKYITHELIDCHKIKDYLERAALMIQNIYKFLDNTQPHKIIVEETMLNSNTDTLKKLAYLGGAVMAYAVIHNIEFKLTLPSEWRKKVGLSQGCKVKRDMLKQEAILAVKNEYNIEVTDDEAEAILIARSGFDLSKINISSDDVWEIVE